MAVVLALLSAPVLAEEPKAESGGGGQMTSVLSGKSMGSGALVHAQIGFPGLSVALLTGGGPLDIGARFSLLYAYEGITVLTRIPGIKLQGVVRMQLLDRGKLNLGLSFSPGLFFYFFPGDTEIGLPLPVNLVLGYAVSPKLMAHLGVDLPIFAVFGPLGGLAIPVLVGGGLEYAVDRQLALTLSLRVGPSVPLTGNGLAYTYWPGYWCYDLAGNPYRCGPYYSFGAPAMEGLFGITYRL